jgi:hypothetical protein
MLGKESHRFGVIDQVFVIFYLRTFFVSSFPRNYDCRHTAPKIGRIPSIHMYIRVQRFLKLNKSPVSVARKSSVLILKNICNLLCVVLAPKLWHEVIEIEVKEFELPGKTEWRLAVFGLFFHYCVYSTRRPRYRTLCGTARLKSLCGGGKGAGGGFRV